MQLPCEICIWKIVPLIKKELVLNLYKKKKKKQVEISRMLHMSKSSVSHYIKGRRAKDLLESNKKVMKIIERMSNKLLKGEKCDSLNEDFCSICKLLQVKIIKKKVC